MIAQPLLPRSAVARQLPFGLGRGLVMEVDFGRDSRVWLVRPASLTRCLTAASTPRSA